jgi:hypothetical protein
MSWLDLVPTCDTVFVYQAALVCEDCASAIMKTLDVRGVENDGDSDSYPQGPHGDGGGEADSAHFCDTGRNCVNAAKVANVKIGCPLGNPLTTDGSRDLRESIQRDLLSTKTYGRKIGRLLAHVWSDYATPSGLAGRVLGDVPTTLSSLLHEYLKKTPGYPTIEPRIYCDTESAYLVGRRGDVVDLLRATADEHGDFKKLDVASIPQAAAEGHHDQLLLEEAVSEGAWD